LVHARRLRQLDIPLHSHLMAKSTTQDFSANECLKDAIRKEQNAAVAFYLKHKDTLLSENSLGTAFAAFRRKLAKQTIRNAFCEEVLKNVEERRRLQAEEEEQKKLSLEEDCLQVDGVNDLDMYPASPRTRAFLYNGVSQNGEGRAKYLLERYKKAPEEKFPARYPVSWDLGWRLGDTIKPHDVKKSPFARVTVVEGAFYSRNGVFFPDDEDSRKKLFR
uniref:MRP-L46 domain-containing protein n=1 Tax=Schistocephalus solidus TaxID=70667 RepID=A0A183TCU7_SCHSO